MITVPADSSPQLHLDFGAEPPATEVDLDPDVEEMSGPVATIPVLGGTAYITMSGVTIARMPASQVSLPPETVIPRDDIRGWSVTDPSVLVPGFIDLFLDATAPLTPVESRTSAHALRFLAGHRHELDFAVDALTAMQAGDDEALARISRLSADSAETEDTAGAKTARNADDANPAAPGSGIDQASGQSKPQAPSFIAFDVETANQENGSICQFGIVVYEDGQETESHTWLCTPPAKWPEFEKSTIAIHGITPDAVADEPTCGERLQQFVELVEKYDLPIVAHNAKFDMTAIRDAAQAEKVKLPALTFACTYLLAREMRPDLPNYKLPTVTSAVGDELLNHHDALADARACGSVMLGLCREGTDTTSSEDGPFRSVAELAAAMGFSMGSVKNNRVWLFRKSRKKSAREQPSAKGPEHGGSGKRPSNWEAVATPDTIPETNEEADPNGPLFGHNVTLTGEFSPLDKGQLWKAIAEAGGTVGKNVTKKTTLLVCGDWQGVTSKQKRAEQLKEKGQDIDIWNQGQLLDALGLN